MFSQSEQPELNEAVAGSFRPFEGQRKLGEPSGLAKHPVSGALHFHRNGQ